VGRVQGLSALVVGADSGRKTRMELAKGCSGDEVVDLTEDEHRLGERAQDGRSSRVCDRVIICSSDDDHDQGQEKQAAQEQRAKG
jgi:hypothetical protein